MLVRLAEIEVDSDRLADYLGHLREEIEAAVAREPGVLALQAATLRDRPGAVRLFEVYADEEAYAAHLRSPHFLAYKAATGAWVRSLRLLEADAVLLRAKPGFGTPHEPG
jgi:quinol monooxygenase YgiN